MFEPDSFEPQPISDDGVQAVALSLRQDLIQLDISDKELLLQLLDRPSSVALVVPADASPEKLWDTLGVCCRAMSKIREASNLIRPVIGRILVIMEDFPREYWESKNFKNFNDFMGRGVWEQFGFSRSEAYKVKKVINAMPSITLEQFGEIGVNKLAILSKVTKEGESTYGDWMAKARTDTVDQLRERTEKKGLTEPGELDPCVIRIYANAGIKSMWDTFSGDPKVQAFCETKAPAVILQRLMQEAAMEWEAQMKEFGPNTNDEIEPQVVEEI